MKSCKRKSGMKTMLFLSVTILMNAARCKVKKTEVNDPAETTTVVTEKKPKQIEASNKKTYPVKEYTKAQGLESYAQAVLAGGCFWCTEAVFERIEGVKDVISGYAGGTVPYPEYTQVGKGKTGHTEAIYIYYDERVVSFETLLDVFFITAHDPTTLNRQGPDVGEEYRSAIYFKTPKQQAAVDMKIRSLNASKKLPGKIVTEVAPYEQFWVAEGYHQNYYELNPKHGYVVRISRPKVLKTMKTFPNLIKEAYKN